MKNENLTNAKLELQKAKDALLGLKNTEGKKLLQTAEDLNKMRADIERLKAIEGKKTQVSSLSKQLDELKNTQGKELLEKWNVIQELKNKIEAKLATARERSILEYKQKDNKGVLQIPESKKTAKIGKELDDEKKNLIDKKSEMSEDRKVLFEEAQMRKIPKEILIADKLFTEEELLTYSVEDVKITPTIPTIIATASTPDTTKTPDSTPATPVKPVGETPEEKTLREGNIEKAKKKLDDARNLYGAEYKKCLDKMKNEMLIDKTRSSIFNIFAKTRNIFHKTKIETTTTRKEEDFYTEKMKDLKTKYEEEKVKLAKVLLEEKEKELKAQGLKGEDLKQALLAYKAGEFLDNVVLTERQKLIEVKKQIPNVMWERIRKAMTFSPKWARKALFIGIAVAISAMTPLGAAFIAQYGIYALIGTKAATSIVVGASTSFLVPRMMNSKKKDEKFHQEQEAKQQLLADKYARGEITIEQYEQETEVLEKKAKRREKLKVVKNIAVGVLVGGIAGGLTYGGISHAFSSFEASHLTNVDVSHGLRPGHDIPQPPSGVTVPPPIHHAEVSVTMDHGHGAIRGFHDLQERLKVEYPDPSKAPVNVQHILNSKPEALAQEYGMYKPGDVSESALIHKGAVLSMDDKGNLTYSDPATHEVDILAGSKAEDFHGRMMDTDHASTNVENNVGAENSQSSVSIINENNIKAPDSNLVTSVDGDLTKFETGDGFQKISHENAYNFMNSHDSTYPQEFSSLEEIQYKVSEVTGMDIMPNTTEDISDYTHRLHEALNNVPHETPVAETISTTTPHVETLGDSIHGIPKVQFEEQVKSYMESHGTTWSSPAEKAKDLWVWEHFGKIEKVGNDFRVVSPNENSTVWNTVSTYHTPAKELLAIPEPDYDQNLVIKPILELKNEVYLKTGLNIEPKPGEDCVEYVLELKKQSN